LLQLKLTRPELKVLAVFDFRGVDEGVDIVVDTLSLAFDAPLTAAVKPHDAAADRDFVFKALGEALEGDLVVRFLDGLGLHDDHASLLIWVVRHDERLCQRLATGGHDARQLHGVHSNNVVVRVI